MKSCRAHPRANSSRVMSKTALSGGMASGSTCSMSSIFYLCSAMQSLRGGRPTGKRCDPVQEPAQTTLCKMKMETRSGI